MPQLLNNQQLLEKLDQNPEVRERIEAMLLSISDEQGELKDADRAFRVSSNITTQYLGNSFSPTYSCFSGAAFPHYRVSSNKTTSRLTKIGSEARSFILHPTSHIPCGHHKHCYTEPYEIRLG